MSGSGCVTATTVYAKINIHRYTHASEFVSMCVCV